LLQENIAAGQRIERGLLEYWDGKEWKSLHAFTTVGYKRLLQFKVRTLQKIRLTILKSRGVAQLAQIGFFKASSKEGG